MVQIASAPTGHVRTSTGTERGVVSRRSVYIARQVSWRAVFAGAVLAMVSQLCLTLLGAGIGLVTIGSGAEGATESSTMSMAAGLWWLITGLVSLFIGGLAAGRLSGVSLCADSVLHGLLVWGVTAIASLLLVANTSTALIGNTFNWLSRTGGMPGMNSVVQGRDTGVSTIKGAAEDVTGSLGLSRENVRDEGGAGANGRDRDGNTAGDRADTAAQRPTDRADAAAGNDRALPADKPSREAASDLGKAAIGTFFALLLGAVAAGLGGDQGRKIFNSYDDMNVVGNQPVDAPEPAASEVTHLRNTNAT